MDGRAYRVAFDDAGGAEVGGRRYRVQVGGDGAAASGAAADELVLLTSIEEDLAAVDAAMAALDGIDASTMDGATAAAQVEAIAGRDRFDLAAPTALIAPTAPAAPTV